MNGTLSAKLSSRNWDGVGIWRQTRRHRDLLLVFQLQHAAPHLRYDMKSGESKLLREAKVDFDPENSS